MSIAVDEAMKVTQFNIAAPTPQNTEPTLSAQHNGAGGVEGDPPSLNKMSFQISNAAVCIKTALSR